MLFSKSKWNFGSPAASTVELSVLQEQVELSVLQHKVELSVLQHKVELFFSSSKYNVLFSGSSSPFSNPFSPTIPPTPPSTTILLTPTTILGTILSFLPPLRPEKIWSGNKGARITTNWAGIRRHKTHLLILYSVYTPTHQRASGDPP